ncbi:MAG: right-handed parallel beta-helix repeat-containing protein [Planctomycetes bacterium]|nr:right-handed parallel beta-helix repeat-containing protein [Planctomycetota bacterium]
MNLRIKRCLSGLMTWAALTGVAIAQSPGESEGTVRLGKPPAVEGLPQGEGVVRLGAQQPVPQPVAEPGPLPPALQSVDPGQTLPGGYFGLQPLDRRFQTRVNVDSRGGGLYGYQAGYTQVGIFQPFATDSENAILFVDARGQVGYDQGGGANVGAGWRWWMSDVDRIIGVSAWFDTTNGGIGPNFQQVGLSFESLGRYVDYRINGYIPAGDHNHVGTSVLNNTASCMGNNIVFQRTTQVAQGYSGLDVETGGPLPIIGRYGVNGYVGAYHFMGAGQAGGSFTGVSGRFMSQINEDVSFGMQVTSDHTFGLNTQFQVFVALPDGTSSRWMRNPQVRDRLTQSVYRQYRAITHIDEVKTTELAVNPTTNLPYFVAFINPNNTTAGTGTDENPFNSIAQFNSLTSAQRAAYDVILVNGRTDGTSTNLDTGLGTATPDQGLVLSDNQHLWGGGLTHSFVTTNGTFLFNCNDVSATPILVNNETSGDLGGTVVTLANNNEVSGVTINGATTFGTTVQNYGIVSQAGGITNGFNINNNLFQNTLEAVQLEHSGSALGLLTSNSVVGGPATGNAVGFQSNAGFDITQGVGTLSLLAQNNTVTQVNGEDANGNGVLDAGEDTNGNATLDIGIGMRFVADGAGAIINANDPTNAVQPLGIIGNTVSGSGAGIDIEALNGGTFNASLLTNKLSNNTTGSSALPTAGYGFAATASGIGSSIVIDTYTDNTTSNNEGDGAVLTANNGGILAVTGDILGPVSGGTTTGNTFTGNQGDGLRVQADNGAIQLQSITSVTFDQNGQNGLNLQVTNGGQIGITDPLSSNAFTSNTLNGLLVNAQSGVISLDLNNTTNANTFNNNGTGALGGNGLLFQTATAGTILTDLKGVTATGNSNDGIGFFLDGGVINVTNIQANVATGNGRDGMSLINSNGGVFNTTNIGGTTPALGNDFSNNARAGLFFGGVTPPTPAAFNNIALIANNNFNRTTTGTEGILFDTTNVFTSNSGADISLIQNTFVGGSATSGRGIGGEVSGGGLMFALGDNQASHANTFTSNKDANIGLVFSADSINEFTIDNHTLSGVVNGTNNLFDGEGVAFILRDTATLTGFIQRSTLQSNAGDAIRIDVTGNDAANFASVNNFTIGGATANLGNTIGGTGLGNFDGIAITRTSSGEVNNMSILNNSVTGNNRNGINLISANAFTTDTYTINNNNVSNNAIDGLRLDVRADAQLLAMVDSNRFNSNGGSGIHTVQQSNNATDQRAVSGIWTHNTINSNGLDGINLLAPMSGLVIGDPVDLTLGNTISFNGRNGINVQGPGDVTIGSNVIATNGTAGTLGTAAETAGIQAHVAPDSNIIIINNHITDTRGDGVEYSIAQGFNGGLGVLTMYNNTIDYNDGRGVDILNRQSNFIQVDMMFNQINRNGLEGVYVVNTSSATQNQFNDSTTALDQNGSIFESPTIEMRFAENSVTGNGFSTTFQPNGPPDSTGLVVRVGTSTTYGFSNPGGFASVGGAVAIDGSPFGLSSGFGGVTMTVDNNTFGGNFGTDITFKSFVSTGSSGGTGTAWDNTQFNPSGYQGDPLSRLDLYFRNNTFDSQNVNNTGNLTGVQSGNTSYVAYYNNADGVFKSRLNNIAAPNIPGPFNSASRRRNAQRQAARYNLPPVSPFGATYLYPGMGDSTFRVSSDSDLSIFLLDFNSPMTNTFDANGTYLPNPTADDMPFGWGTF